MSGPESSSADPRKWIGAIVIAVVLGEAIWAFLVSITVNLALPAMAKMMGGDAQSPLYLGKGDFNVQALFTSFLELCFAGIIAVLLNSWSQKPGQARPKAVRLVQSEARAAPVVTPHAASAAADTTIQETQEPVRSVTSTPPSSSPHLVQPAEPKSKKAVYYNIVGDPVEPFDE
jgi:hypothetical protein